MRLRNHGFLIGLLSAAATASAADAPDGAAAFERLKGLVGVWEVTQPAGKKATVRYELTAGGSALYEHYADSSTGAGNEMITMYVPHRLGPPPADALLHGGESATHGVEALRSGDRGARFRFSRRDGLKDENAGHMRRAQFRLLDQNRYTSRWEFVENGKPTFDEKQELTRVSSSSSSK